MKSFLHPCLRALCALLLTLSALHARGADFFDTSAPEVPFRIGARIGVNTSNLTLDKNIFDRWNENSWGTGFDIGAVADIALRDYLVIQPGFFFQSRSGNHTYVNMVTTPEGTAEMIQYGHRRSYAFNIPVVCSIRFNLSDDVRWSVDAGPYISLILKNSLSSMLYVPAGTEAGVTGIEPRKFDAGLKFGTGLNILGHYYLGVHYWAGATHPWKDSAAGGASKAWSFTLGYDF